MRLRAPHDRDPHPTSRATPTCRTAVAAALLPFVLVTLTACGDSADAEGDSGAVDVEHVHALEVDPADPDRVLVATHHGLAAWTESSGLGYVGELRSDFMGFNVGPDGTFYASGHPGEGEDGPFALGLISSGDGGETWQDVSLSGEADFHALDADDDGVFGFDAANGILRVSTDGRAWTDVPTDVGFIDLAADPTSQRVVGTTEEGDLVESTDGGRSFSPVSEAPPLVLVDFAPDGTLTGIGTDGSLHTWSETDGWQQREGSADRGLQAFTAGPDGAVWLLDGRGLMRSDDRGDSFSEAAPW